MYVLVGFNKDALAALAGCCPPGSVIVVEEPDIMKARRVEEHVAANTAVAGFIGAPVQDEHDPRAIVAAVPRPPGVRAVVPMNEYGVVAAAVLAHEWGLPGATVGAALTLRDKLRLRERCAKVPMSQPVFRAVSHQDEVLRFRAEHKGECVLKPSNRQGSLGVQLLGPDDDVDTAWERCVREDAPQRRPQRPLPSRFLVEERLRGVEVSVEALVRNGAMLFTNTTKKEVLSGIRPVETGHTVPADLPASVTGRLVEAMRDLIEAVGFDTGVLHAEWMLVSPHDPYLIECAARLPGDSIDRLIDLAYGGSLLKDLLVLLSGGIPAARALPTRAAAIRFLHAPPGEVVALTGVEAVRALDGVQAVDVSVSVGETVGVVNHSWDRSGSVVTTGPGPREAAATAQTAVEAIGIQVRPVP
jgi:biotin carboxylase